MHIRAEDCGGLRYSIMLPFFIQDMKRCFVNGAIREHSFILTPFVETFSTGPNCRVNSRWDGWAKLRALFIADANDAFPNLPPLFT